ASGHLRHGGPPAAPASLVWDDGRSGRRNRYAPAHTWRLGAVTTVRAKRNCRSWVARRNHSNAIVLRSFARSIRGESRLCRPSLRPSPEAPALHDRGFSILRRLFVHTGNHSIISLYPSAQRRALLRSMAGSDSDEPPTWVDEQSNTSRGSIPPSLAIRSDSEPS